MTDVNDASDPKKRKQIHPRIARRKLSVSEDYLGYLELAKRARMKLDGDVSEFDQMVSRAQGFVDHYTNQAYGRVDPRRRPPPQKSWRDSDPPRNQYLLCIDECGSHQVNPRGDLFPAFCLCGVIVNVDHYPAFDRAWRRWKAIELGSPDVIVHEPDVRKRTQRFYCADEQSMSRLLNSLEDELHRYEFIVISAAIDKASYAHEYGDGGIDDFLPRSQYLMCLDFVMERFVHFLTFQGDDAKGSVIAESRGLLEDLLVQQEYVRLQVEGTQFVASTWFRYQLLPYIQFLPKSRNHSGLQIADLAARPCAEKVLNPSIDPERWEVVSKKLYDGGKGEPAKYGLKSLPSHSGATIFSTQTNEDAETPPSAD